MELKHLQFGNRLKELRARDGLSQQTLADRIYVTRQTVGNWECDRSYPDLQSLMMLSALFNVSIDEMVKGDLEIMNNMNTELDAHKFKMWFIVQIICLALFTASIIVTIFLRWWGLIIPTGFIALFFIAYIPWMRIAKKHKLKTFGEMKAFIKNTERPVYTKPPWYIRHKALFYLLTILISTVSAVIVFSILFYLFVPEFFTELFGE